MKGLSYIKEGLQYVFPVLAGGVLAFLSAKSEGAAALGVIGLAVGVVVLYLMGKGERTGYIVLLMATYFSTGLTRYVPLPLGLSVDVLLLLIFLLFFFKIFNLYLGEISKIPFLLRYQAGWCGMCYKFLIPKHAALKHGFMRCAAWLCTFSLRSWLPISCSISTKIYPNSFLCGGFWG